MMNREKAIERRAKPFAARVCPEHQSHVDPIYWAYEDYHDTVFGCEDA